MNIKLIQLITLHINNIKNAALSLINAALDTYPLIADYLFQQISL